MSQDDTFRDLNAPLEGELDKIVREHAAWKADPMKGMMALCEIYLDREVGPKLEAMLDDVLDGAIEVCRINAAGAEECRKAPENKAREMFYAGFNAGAGRCANDIRALKRKSDETPSEETKAAGSDVAG